MTLTQPPKAQTEINPKKLSEAKKISRSAWWSRQLPILMVTPMVVLAAIMVLFPAVLTFIGSFFQIPFTGGEWKFVGFENFSRVFTTNQITQSIINTLVYSVLTIIPSLAIGLALALGIESVTRGKALLRTLLFLPMTANLVAMAVVFAYIFDYRLGILNGLLETIGVAPINWLGDTNTSLLTVSVVGIWRTASFTMMIFFAGLATIPGTMMEAARMDGLSGLTKVFRIIIPTMKPSVVFATVMAVLQSVQAFDTVRVMTDGGPQYSSELIQTMAWRLGFEYFDLGTASALSFIMIAVLIAVGLWQRRVLGGKDK